MGTAEEYFYRRAQEITQQHGYATYRVVQFQSGMQRMALGSRPVATGVIQLYKTEQEADTSSGMTLPAPQAPQGADTSPHASTRKPGSGFFVDGTADTLTNYRVVKGCSDISISGPVPEAKVAILASDPPADLALLHAAGSLSVNPLRFREGPGPRAGDGIVAIGFPLHGVLASEPNVTTGTVSALAGMRNDDRYVQITAPVQPGNSGGPLLDMSGNVVGVVSAKLDALKLASVTGDVPENVNFAVKYLIVRNFLDTHAVRYETSPSTAQLSRPISLTAPRNRRCLFPANSLLAGSSRF